MSIRLFCCCRRLSSNSILREPSSLNRLLHPRTTPLQSHQRNCSTPDYVKAMTPVPHDEFGPLYTIYKNPNMQFPSIWNRGKFIALPIFLVVSVAQTALYYSGDIGLEELQGCFAMQVILYLKILACNQYFKNVVGYIYLTEDDNLVVSYVDKNGNRKDEKFQSGSLQFQPYKRNFLNKYYVPLVSTDKRRTFKLNLRNGELVEEAILIHIGELP